MEPNGYTNDAEVLLLLKQLHEERVPEKWFSDITDGTHQYVDLVMEGGGVLGVALAGYVYVLEEMGIRFLKLGGTSAGAINTMLMAAAGPIELSKTNWILEKIANKNFYDFVDGDSKAKAFIDAIINDSPYYLLALKGLRVIGDFKNDFGLCAGQAFYEWIRSVMREKNIYTLKDLKELRKIAPSSGIYNRYVESIRYTPEDWQRIVIVAADITTQSEIIFPEMANLYWAYPDEVCPAEFVRASMSIPFFFMPYRVKNIPPNPLTGLNWQEATGFKGIPPTEVLFVDGGLMSNFPIEVFHNHKVVPVCPTFGIKLGYDRMAAQKTATFFGYTDAMFNASRHIKDYDFIAKHPDYSHLLGCIDTGTHNWLNFHINDADRLDLFRRGAQAAADFLRRFNWQQYKEIRQGLMDAYRKK